MGVGIGIGIGVEEVAEPPSETDADGDSFQMVAENLDPVFQRGDNFLQAHQNV